MDDQLPLADSAGRISRAVLFDDQTAHEPDVALVGSNPWIVWSARGRDGDCIRLRPFTDTTPVLEASSTRGVESQPCLLGQSDGSLRIVWIAYREATWQLLTREYRDGTLGPEAVLARNPEGLFHPRALVDTQGDCWVVYEEVLSQVTRLAVLRLQEGRPLAVRTPEGPCSRPALSLGPAGGVWVAYDCYGEGHFGVFLQRLDVPSGPIPVTEDGYQNLHASLDRDKAGNLWIAWASNANAAFRDQWWLTKWVRLCRFDGEAFAVPAGPQPGRDLYNEDAWQGWEFPTVTVDRYGRIWVFGQASHTLYAQYLDDRGWSPLQTIADRHWGSWKPRVRAAGRDPVFLVSMGLQGAQMQRIDIAPTHGEVRLAAPAEAPAAAVRSRARAERPSLTTGGGERLAFYFGDLHAHSTYSDALNDVDEFYSRYRDAYGYDFAALTDHDFLDGMELSRSELAMIWNHADRVTRPGEFVAFYGYEWTAPALADHAGKGRTVGEGHRHILYPDKTGPLISYGEESANTGKKLLRRLHGVRALVIPHHTAWSGTDWDAHDPELQRLIEICSTHGRFEFPGNRPIGYRRDHLHPGKFVLDALARGYRLGFVGGSDSHGLRWHATEMEGRAHHIPPGTRVGWKEDAFRTGMTVILAPELTREALFAALYDRRCYATSGEPIVLDFRVNGELMGSELTTPAPPQLAVSVLGTSPIRSIDIVRSGYPFGGLQCLPGEGVRTLDLSMEDTMIIPGETHYYYIRVLQEDGNMAWSSPIWVHRKGG
jgi:hypothetical protein